MVSLRAPRPVRVKSLWREGDRGEERERRKSDGDMGREAGERPANNRREEGRQTIMQFTFIFNFRLFSPKPPSTVKRIPILHTITDLILGI